MIAATVSESRSPGQVYAVDAGADVGAQFHHINGLSHGFISAGVGREVNRLADRDPNSRLDGENVKTVNFALRLGVPFGHSRASVEGVTVSQKRSLKVAIIGAGMSGLCMAAKLQDAGIDTFTIFEQADEVGGTWRDNTYPGLTCDVPSRFYSYSFRPNPDWSHASVAGAGDPVVLPAGRDRARHPPAHPVRHRSDVGAVPGRPVVDRDRCRW